MFGGIPGNFQIDVSTVPQVTTNWLLFRLYFYKTGIHLNKCKRLVANLQTPTTINSTTTPTTNSVTITNYHFYKKNKSVLSLP